MKIIAVAHRSPNRLAEGFLETEAKKVLPRVAEDVVREVYSRHDGKCAVLLLEADSLEDAERRFQELSFVQNDLLRDLRRRAVYGDRRPRRSSDAQDVRSPL